MVTDPRKLGPLSYVWLTYLIARRFDKNSVIISVLTKESLNNMIVYKAHSLAERQSDWVQAEQAAYANMLI